MAPADPAALSLLVAAFAGGVFGAAIGALPSFAVTGLLVVVGETLAVTKVGASHPLLADFTAVVAFGPTFGPHVAFGGGAAALAYAARREDLDIDTGYHPAKAITRGVGRRPLALAVGGCFGVLGHAIAALAGALALPTDPVALGVVGSALAHRVAFGYPLVGAPAHRLIDMSPFEDGIRVEDAGPRPDGGRRRFVVEPWLPHQSRWPHVAVLGLVVGLLAAALAYGTGSAFLGFGLSVVPLGLLTAGVERVPVTHHVSLPASTGVLALAGESGGFLAPARLAASVPLADALVVGAALGLLGALLGELAQRALYAHADTHLDPPAASIVLTSLLLAGLVAVGLLPSASWLPIS